MVAGLLGTTSGSTAYAENVGAISITGVASRRVVQTGACLMIGISLIGAAPLPLLHAALRCAVLCCDSCAWPARTFAGMPFMSPTPAPPLPCAPAGKFGAVFASIPQALAAGVFAVMFSLIAGVGEGRLLCGACTCALCPVRL